jgi:murein DD-endopeptidase MepM/ murein hydrolase activator NlpD
MREPRNAVAGLALCAAAVLIPLLLASCAYRAQPVAAVAVRRAPDLPVRQVYRSPVTSPEQISSTFGPRWQYSRSRDDFHRGIDFFGERGEPVFAIGDGVVVRRYAEGSKQFPNGGNTLIIRHLLAEPVQWQGKTIDKFYALYLHLEGFRVAKGERVSAGQNVGEMGSSGTTSFVHLHFEVRVQTYCSLKYQLAHPESSCAGFGFDPHVHPFPFIGGANADEVTLAERPGEPYVLYYTATRGDLDLNRIETDQGRIDFNRRTGIDARSTGTLDDFDYGWLRLSPEPFRSRSTKIRYRLEFPRRPKFVELTDIHGYAVRHVPAR